MKYTLNLSLAAALSCFAISDTHTMDAPAHAIYQAAQPTLVQGVPNNVPCVIIPLALYQNLMASHAKLQQLAKINAELKATQATSNPGPQPVGIGNSRRKTAQNRTPVDQQPKKLDWRTINYALKRLKYLAPSELLQHGIECEAQRAELRFSQACFTFLQAATQQNKDLRICVEACERLARLAASNEVKKQCHTKILQCHEEQLKRATNAEEKLHWCHVLIKLYLRKPSKSGRLRELCTMLLNVPNKDPNSAAAHTLGRYYLSLQ